MKEIPKIFENLCVRTSE